MTVYKRGGVWWNDFVYRGARDNRSTGQITKEAAEAVERQRKDAARQRAHGVAIEATPLTPRFQDWGEIYYAETARKVKAADRVQRLVRAVLRFFGARPADPADVYPGAPYHDLRLGDVVERPAWLIEFETWLHEPKRNPAGKRTGTLRWSGQTRNQHRSTLSGMFTLAAKPQWRDRTGVTMNPCAGLDRDRRRRRTAVLAREDVEAILRQASYHLRLAIAIALLTPKLREADILQLQFDRHFSQDFAWLTVRGHKTERHTERPLVAYVPTQLRAILTEARKRSGRSAHVITYQGRPIAQLCGAVKGAVERARTDRPHLRYGRDRDDGITFHTLRHAAATFLAELGVPLQHHRNVMGHERIETTLWYTHLRPLHEIAPAEALSAALPIQDLVLVARRRPPRRVG